MNTKIKINNLIPFIAFFGLFIIFSIATNGSAASSYNLHVIVGQVIPIVLGGLGVIFVISQGSVDLSIGGTAAVSATIGAMAAAKYGFVLMFPVSILIGIIIGLINGVIITRFKVSSFMTTLAMLISLRGFLNYLLSKKVVFAPDQAVYLNVFFVQFTILVIAIVIMGYLFEYTKMGRYSKAIGENETTSNYIGISVTKVRIMSFVYSGIMASIVGIFQLCKLGGSSSTLGQFFEMKVMMAIFLGGVLVTGGMSSRIYKLILGAFTIVVIENGLILCNVDGSISEAVQGLLLMLVLFVTLYFNARANRAAKKSAANKAEC